MVLDVVYWCQLRLDMVYVVSYELTRCGRQHTTTDGDGTGSELICPRFETAVKNFNVHSRLGRISSGSDQDVR